MPFSINFAKYSKYKCLIGTGGIGYGIFFNLNGDKIIGRNESRLGRLLDRQDFCKLHIISHYVSVFLGKGKKGFTVIPVGKVGYDDVSKKLLDKMIDAGMDISYVRVEKGINTLFSVCFQYPDGSGGNITTDNSASSLVCLKDIDRVRKEFKKYKGHGIVLAAPEIPMRARKRLLYFGRKYVFFNTAAFSSGEIRQALNDGYFKMVDLVSINVDEAEALAGMKYNSKKELPFFTKCVNTLTRYNPMIHIAITLGSKGSFGYEDGNSKRIPAFKVNIKNTAGAGDSYLSGLIIALICGIPFISSEKNNKIINDAISFASLLASFKTLSGDTINFNADIKPLVSFAKNCGATFSEQFRKIIK